MNNSNYLAHYGVLGMKWGVRKKPDRAYSKSINKLRKLDKKQARVDKKRQKLTKKTAKLLKKSNRMMDKAVSPFTSEDKALKRFKKSRRISKKAQRLSKKAVRYDRKDKRLQKKGEKWVKAMNENFKETKLSNVSAKDIAYGKKKAVEIAHKFDVKAVPNDEAKHADISDEIYYGVMRASEHLEHYGVKGMKWGVRKDPKVTTKTTVSVGGKVFKDGKDISTGGGGGGGGDDHNDFDPEDMIDSKELNKMIKDDPEMKGYVSLWQSPGVNTRDKQVPAHGYMTIKGSSKTYPPTKDGIAALKSDLKKVKKATTPPKKNTAINNELSKSLTSKNLKPKTETKTMSIGKSKRTQRNEAIADTLKKKRRSFGKG